MPSPDLSTLAGRRLRLMQQSGVAAQITAAQMATRHASAAARRLHGQQADDLRVGDVQDLRKMLLLIEGTRHVRTKRKSTALSSSYDDSKRLITTLVDTSPTGAIGKRHDWGNTFVTAGDAIGAAVPTMIGAAASAMADITGIKRIETAAAVGLRGAEILDATLGVARLTQVAVPAATSAVAGANASLIEACLDWWMNPVAAAAVSSYLPLLELLGPISAGVKAYGKHKKLDPMLALGQRYPNTCTCNACIADIANGWQDRIAGTMASLHPAMALGLVMYDTQDKIRHYVRKKRAKDNSVHRDSYYTAEKLWLAAQDGGAPTHRVFTAFSSQIASGRRCPLAMLTLALLFGGGHIPSGIIEATAAIVSDQVGAVTEIKTLVAG